MSQAVPYDMQCKLLMIGDSGVGKTCLLLRYANDSFSPTFITTIGIDFKIKNIEVDGKRIKMQIWDTAGQERFQSLGMAFYRGADACVLVYNITNSKSFQKLITKPFIEENGLKFPQLFQPIRIFAASGIV